VQHAIILPLLVFILVLPRPARVAEPLGPSRSLRVVFLETSAFVGGYLMIFSEGLGLLKQLGQGGAAICWGIGILITGPSACRKACS